MAYAIQGLRDMPGRKAVALFSGGFAQSPDGIVELANRASVVVYTFDPRGIPPFFLRRWMRCRPPAATPAVRSKDGNRRTTRLKPLSTGSHVARREISFTTTTISLKAWLTRSTICRAIIYSDTSRIARISTASTAISSSTGFR